MLVLFTLWSLWRLKKFSERPADESDWIMFVLKVLGFYFLSIETVLLVSHTTSYLKSPWSYVKLIPVILVLINTFKSADLEKNISSQFWYR